MIIALLNREGEAYPGRLLGLREMNIPALIELIRKGIPWIAVPTFVVESGFTEEQIRRFLEVSIEIFDSRRRLRKLAPEESERLLRLAEIFDAVHIHLGKSRESTRLWLTSPKRQLNFACPLDYVRSDLGARQVRRLISELKNDAKSRSKVNVCKN